MADTAQIKQWWDALTGDERDLLRQANGQFPMEADATKLLFDTDCPALPVGTSFDPSDGLTIGMPGDVAELINEENND